MSLFESTRVVDSGSLFVSKDGFTGFVVTMGFSMDEEPLIELRDRYNEDNIRNFYARDLTECKFVTYLNGEEIYENDVLTSQRHDETGITINKLHDDNVVINIFKIDEPNNIINKIQAKEDFVFFSLQGEKIINLGNIERLNYIEEFSLSAVDFDIVFAEERFGDIKNPVFIFNNHDEETVTIVENIYQYILGNHDGDVTISYKVFIDSLLNKTIAVKKDVSDSLHLIIGW